MIDEQCENRVIVLNQLFSITSVATFSSPMTFNLFDEMILLNVFSKTRYFMLKSSSFQTDCFLFKNFWFFSQTSLALQTSLRTSSQHSSLCLFLLSSSKVRLLYFPSNLLFSVVDRCCCSQIWTVLNLFQLNTLEYWNRYLSRK